MDKKILAEGFREAERITRKFAKTFYLASLFLPKDKKYASYAVYAICRLSDDSVDNPENSDPRARLREIEKEISAAYTESSNISPLLAAFRITARAYQIPKEYFEILIQGMYMDLEIKGYADFRSLYKYCWQVAGVVGLIMLKILGSKNKAAQAYAVKLGIAMQLTNILRDINEDLKRNRVYLPENEMADFGILKSQLLEKNSDGRLKSLLRFQIQRCHEFYADSLPGIKLIDDRKVRFVVLVMQENYRLILSAIQKNDYNIFSKRAQVSKLKKIMTVIKILLEGKYL